MFKIKDTGDKNNISTPMFYGLGKKSLYFGSLYTSAFAKNQRWWVTCLLQDKRIRRI